MQNVTARKGSRITGTERAELTAEVNDVGTLGSTKTRLMIIGSDGSHCLQSHSKLTAPVNGLADPSGHHFAAEGFSRALGKRRSSTTSAPGLPEPKSK